MALFNFASKEVTLKVVYYGPGLSGKTTNLQYLHPVLDKEKKSKLLSLSTEADRTLFFDFLPVELGKIKDFSIRFQLYTVPGQVRYNATRRLVLKGADAVVFVADSQRDMREQNLESFENMRENLAANNIDPDGIPIVLQYNKRDLPNILSVEELDRDMNVEGGYSTIEAEAINGKGVVETFQLVTRLLIEDISRRHRVSIGSEAETEPIQEPVAELLGKKSPEEIGREAETAVKGKAYEGTRPDGLVMDEKEEKLSYEAISREEMLGGGVTSPSIETAGSRIESSPTEEDTVPEVIMPEEQTYGKAVGNEEIERMEEEILRASAPPEAAGVAPDAYRQEIEGLGGTVTELSATIRSLKDTVEKLSREMRETKPETPLKELSNLQGMIESTLAEVSKEAKESKTRHHEILGALKELKFILSNLKAKKSWFRI